MSGAARARAEAAAQRNEAHESSRAEVDVDWQAHLKAALADIQARLKGAGSGHRSPLFFDAATLFERDYEETPWLVTGLIPRTGTMVIGGEPKTTKSWVAVEIALAIATGTPVFGEFAATNGRVAYFFAEDAARQVFTRVRALLAGRWAGSLPVGALHVRPRGEFIDLLRDEDLALIVASCRCIGQIDLLVLDPLRDISSAQEDSSDSVRDLMRRLRVLGELLGCTVLVVHHTAKASEASSKRRGGQRLRGSGAIHGSLDAGLYLSGTEGNGTNLFVNVVDSELKGARAAGRFTLELEVDDDAKGEAVKADWTVTRPDAGASDGTDAKKARRESADRDVVVRRVTELASAGEQPMSKSSLREAVPGVPDKRARVAIEREIGKRLTVRDIRWGERTLKDRVVLV